MKRESVRNNRKGLDGRGPLDPPKQVMLRLGGLRVSSQYVLHSATTRARHSCTNSLLIVHTHTIRSTYNYHQESTKPNLCGVALLSSALNI